MRNEDEEWTRPILIEFQEQKPLISPGAEVAFSCNRDTGDCGGQPHSLIAYPSLLSCSIAEAEVMAGWMVDRPMETMAESQPREMPAPQLGTSQMSLVAVVLVAAFCHGDLALEALRNDGVFPLGCLLMLFPRSLG